MSRKKQCTPVPFSERTGTATIRSCTKFTKQLATLSLALLWLSLVNATTPDYVLPFNGNHEEYVLPQCDSTYTFTSDTLLSHTYFDSKRRKSTITFCPQSSEQEVEVRFLDFDVAVGDSLFAYDGTNSNFPLLGHASNADSLGAFGGALCVSHTNAVNPKGCLTFVFQTNGDGIGGKGWEATLTCKERYLEIILPHISNQQLVCGQQSVNIIIPPAQLLNNCGLLNNDYTTVKITEITTGVNCGETSMSYTANSIFSHPFGAGTFQIEYIHLLDTTLSGSLTFTIESAPLVCQQIVNLSVGANCDLVVTPEMFIEDYCPPTPNGRHYSLVIKTMEGRIIANGSTLNNDYPSLPLSTMDLCGTSSYIVEIQQAFTIDNSSTICTEKEKLQTCNSLLIIEDDTPPYFEEGPQSDTLFACHLDLTTMLSILQAPRTKDACGSAQAQLEEILPFNTTTKCNKQPDYIITWSASDQCGNKAIRMDTLKVHRPKIVRNIDLVNITESCEAGIDIRTTDTGYAPYLQEGMQAGGQFHPMDTLSLSFTSTICNYLLQKTEVERVTTCGKELIKYWYLIDNCSTPIVNIPLDTQIIQILDTLAPYFTNCSTANNLAAAEQIDLPANSCQISIDFPLPTAIDNCDDKPIVKEFTVQKLVNGEWSNKAISLFNTSLSDGTFRVGYEASDACTMSTRADTCYRYFVINNPVTPSINCSAFASLASAEQINLPANTCQMNLNFPLPTVAASCENPSVKELVVQELINGQWLNKGTALTQTAFSTGTFRVGYTLDLAIQTDICYRYFIIRNPIKQAINCSNFSSLASAEQIGLMANDCQLSLNFPLPTVTDNCGNPIVKELVVQELINGQWLNLGTTLAQTAFSTGTFRVGYTLDLATQSDICFRYFIISEAVSPSFNCSAFASLATAEQISLPANDCTINLNFSPPTVTDNCENPTVQEFIVQKLVNGQWLNIGIAVTQISFTTGTFRVGYTVDLAIQTDICYRYFIINNPVIPSINCSAFSSLASAEQIDLTDNNCQINLNFPPPTVRDNCENPRVQEFVVQELINGQWLNAGTSLIQTAFSTGTFRVGYTLDLAIQTDICYRYFIINDPINPSINCSDFNSLPNAEQIDLTTNNCQINLNFPLPTLTENCKNVDIIEAGVQELVNKQWLNIGTSLIQTSFTTGTFRVGYTLNAPNQSDICYRYFIIKTSVRPSINCSAFNSLANAEQFDLLENNCQISLNFPLPTVAASCESPNVKELEVQALANGQWTTKANSLTQMAFSVDTFRVLYTLESTTLTDTCYRYFIVRDSIAPLVTCRQDITISLDDNGTATLAASDLNAASSDNCGVAQVLIKRNSCLEGDMRTEEETMLTSGRIDLNEWSTSINFECCDLGKVINLDLLVIDESGNYASCSATTTPSDKVVPLCRALPPVLGFCDEYATTDFGRPTDINGDKEFDLLEWLSILPSQLDFYNEAFGNPIDACRDNLTCLLPQIEQEYQLIEGNCSSIQVKRRYRAIDISGNASSWIEQIIKIDYRPAWTVKLPADEFTNCDADKITAPISPITNGPCDRLSWTATDEIVEFAPGGLLEILRRFTIINNCVSMPDDQWLEIERQEDGQGIVKSDLMVQPSDYPGEGHFSYIQKIRIVDNEAPFLVLGEIDTLLYGKGDAEPFGEEDLTREDFPFECDEVREFTVFARDCNEPSTETLTYNWTFSNDGQIIQMGTGNSFFKAVSPDTLYTVQWVVQDVFGNQSDTLVNYQFVDAAPPTAICAKGITVSISPTTRTVSIPVDTLDGGSFDNCDDQINLSLFMWSNLMRIDTPQTNTDINLLPTEIIFNCTDIGEQEILLYVMDESGNFSTCKSIIEILADPEIDCDETMVGGTIVDRFGMPIQNTSITIIKQDAKDTIQSNAAGNYDILLPMDKNYVIKPSISTNPLNGVSTYDLVLLSQHILGANPFTSPYQYIAGDVNRSGTITAFDLVQLRQLILNKLKYFPNNDSWRFINANYEFKSNNPLTEQLEEEYTIDQLTATNVYMDFIGIKIGDLSGDAQTSNMQQAQQRQSTTNFYLHTPDQRLEKGKFYTVPFHAPQLENIIGFQGTIKSHDLILTNITGGKMTPEHFHGWRQGSTGFLTFSCNSLYSHDNNNTAPYLFSLTFQANKDGQLNELLQLTSEPTTAEAYSFSGEWLALSLTFQNQEQHKDLNFGIPAPPSSSTGETTAMLPSEGGVFKVFPNKPNPFVEQTIISFYLPNSALTALSVFNIHGQSILQTQQIYPQGTNQIKFVSDQLPNGTYFYQVATPFGVATHKMVVAR